MNEALDLLMMPNKIPLSGGTHLSQDTSISKDLIDLQDLELNKINISGHCLEIGATVKLQELLTSKVLPQSFETAIQLEEPLNIRNMASVGGLLITCTGRSPIITSFLTMNASVKLQPGSESMELQDFLDFRADDHKNYLVTSVIIQIPREFSFQYISRTKFDKPIICAALSTFANRKRCLALGGFGKYPIIVYKGTNEIDLPLSARNAYNKAEDEWSTAEYRAEMAEVLTKSCINNLS